MKTLENPTPHVVELGAGPGYMAQHILERHDALTFEAVDFSEVFFDIARQTIGEMADRSRLHAVDLKNAHHHRGERAARQAEREQRDRSKCRSRDCEARMRRWWR